MRMTLAPDHDLLGEALRGPSPSEAAGSLAFWRGRLEWLPMHRLAARREARAMVAAWEERLRGAELERFGGGLLGRAAGAAAVLRGERPAALLRRAIRTLLPRRLVTGAVAVTLALVLILGVVLGSAVAALF